MSPLGAPLVVAGTIAAMCALAGQVHPLAAMVSGLVVALVAGPLALLSGDRPRRLLWSAAAFAGLGSAVRAMVIVPPLAISADAHVVGLREALAVPLRTLIPEPEAGIVLGIVLGERASITRDLRTAFAVTGTTHILAISGFNMTLVAAATTLALRGRVPPVVTAVMTIASVAGYSVLVGPQPSVVRAALMASVGAFGLALGRRGVAANSLGGAAAAMLLIDPATLGDAGFLLSVASTAGLIAFDRDLVARLAALPSWMREGLAATIAASLPTIPFVAAIFGRVSLISPIANLAAVPLFEPIMVFGAATAAVGAVAPDGAWPLALVTYASAAAFRHVVEVCAAVPFAAVSVPTGVGTGAAVTVAMLALAVGVRAAIPLLRSALFSMPLRRPRWSGAARALLHVGRPGRALLFGGAAVLCVAAIIAGAVGASAIARSPAFRIRALDIGQGDSFLVESDGRYALIDGGPDPALALRRLGEALPPWRRRIDLVALSHEHADHGAGLLGVLDRYEVGLAIEPVGMNDGPFVRQWSEALSRLRIPRRAVAEGAVVRLGGVVIRVLGPGRDRRVDVPSLAMRVESASGSVLLLGDSVDDAIADLLLTPASLSARLFVPQHHGAESPHTRALVAAVKPEAVVISVGAGNKYGHPTPATLAALEGLPVYRTDRYGTVEVDLDGHPLVVHTAKAGVPPDRGGPVPSAPPAR